MKNAFPLFPSTLNCSNRLLLGVFLLLALASWWLRQQIEDEAVREPGIISAHTADYWATNLSSRVMDEQGHLLRILTADSAQHFPDDGSAELVNPQIKFVKASGPAWRVQSETGWVSHSADLVRLNGAVTMYRNAISGGFPVHITTKNLQVKPKDEYAETEQPVQMVTGSHWIKSKGLQVWFKPPMRIKLLANVRAHYEAVK
jgi:lipopolysaccharide export system protein LptC